MGGTSYLIVTTGKPVCKSVELPQGAYVKILFEAPGKRIKYRRCARSAVRGSFGAILCSNDRLMIVDLNTASNGATPGPAYLTITETPTLSAIDAIHEEEGEMRRKPDRPSPPISHEMKNESGSFVHTVKRDSDVQICIRASAAGSKNPMRFALRLEEMGDEEEAEVDSPPAIAVDVHLSSMEEQLNRIESQMHAMLREADFAKERDSVYHTKTDAMNKATTFWPIVHVCILLATGFTQANHIVSFFKKRRII